MASSQPDESGGRTMSFRPFVVGRIFLPDNNSNYRLQQNNYTHIYFIWEPPPPATLYVSSPFAEHNRMAIRPRTVRPSARRFVVGRSTAPTGQGEGNNDDANGHTKRIIGSILLCVCLCVYVSRENTTFSATNSISFVLSPSSNLLTACRKAPTQVTRQP